MGLINHLDRPPVEVAPGVLRPGTAARSFKVSTAEELSDALAAPHDAMNFIEVVMDPMDAPDDLIASGLGIANLDFGPRGPQHRPGARITLNGDAASEKKPEPGDQRRER